MNSSLNKKESEVEEVFSLNTPLLEDILQYAKPFGHHEDRKNLNLGFGFIYYGVVRALRPKHIAVIGSGYGFSVVCLALGMKDNGCGQLSFVDPSYSLLKDGPLKTIGGRGTWDDKEEVRAHFSRFQVEDIVKHHKMKSEEFFAIYNILELPPLDMAFIDGSHTYKNVRHDFCKVLEQSHKNSYIFLHDTNIYIRELLNNSGVMKWLKNIKMHTGIFEVINFPFSSGVALVRVRESNAWKQML